ncbi:MAG TPA: hypothetical protein VLJ11_07935 [Bryobacteraceae bacterium]|nr:hypothetical protein [Bryobacteraceae bacterium]
MRSIETLLRGLIDYAGLFPPASLDLSSAAANYRTYLGQRYSWALGRFVVPLSLLNNFAAHREGITDHSLSILGEPEQLSRLNSPAPRASVFEVKTKTPTEVASLRKALPVQTIFLEAHDGKWTSELFEAVAAADAGAKIRTGGINASNFPSPHEIVAFMKGCRRAKIPWKATAGLHHPFPGVHPLRYEPDSPSAMMHGFVNVFLAATLIYCSEAECVATALLNEQSPAAFVFDHDGVTWRGYRLTTSQLRDTREQFAISFGSCSFTEPISDLQDLGLL